MDSVVVTETALSTRCSALLGMTLIEYLKECRTVDSNELVKVTYDLNVPLGALQLCNIKSDVDSQGVPPLFTIHK